MVRNRLVISMQVLNPTEPSRCNVYTGWRVFALVMEKLQLPKESPCMHHPAGLLKLPQIQAFPAPQGIMNEEQPHMALSLLHHMASSPLHMTAAGTGLHEYKYSPVRSDSYVTVAIKDSLAGRDQEY